MFIPDQELWVAALIVAALGFFLWRFARAGGYIAAAEATADALPEESLNDTLAASLTNALRCVAVDRSEALAAPHLEVAVACAVRLWSRADGPERQRLRLAVRSDLADAMRMTARRYGELLRGDEAALERYALVLLKTVAPGST